ncbi:hypothetical protein [Brevundimonas sp.]|uniref:hypothetical protein n=1 Tax=Brevundimonas sp. TaxID=1871086 RepID=UPI00257B5349|nr:hypothetical protein [Brevundimonas sp.]
MTKVEMGSGTACWCFKKGKNQITFFDGIEVMFSKIWKKPKVLIQAIKQVFRHEIGHALYSPRDKSFFAIMKKEGIPFRLWNLFEDCRIEFKLWDNFRDLGLFYWHKYIIIGKDITCATNALLELKMRDAGARVERAKTLKVERFFPAPDKVKFDLMGKSYNWHRKTISRFYRRAIKLHDSEKVEMIELLKEWIKIYGKEVEGSEGFAEDSPFSEEEITGDEASAAESSEGEEGEETTGEEGSTVEHEDRTATDKTGSAKVSKSGACEGIESFKVKSWADSGEQATSHRIFSQLLPIIKRARLSPEEIGRRGKLYIKRAMQGLADCFRSSIPRDGKRKVYLLLDMSGSMGYDYENGLGQISSAFAKLRDSGLIELRAYLTKGNESGKQCLADMSGASPDLFLKLQPDGGSEMIKGALDKTKLDLMSSDSCFILTDGDIVDEAVAPNYWRAQGVDLVGVCVGFTDADIRGKRSHMDRHFSRSFIAEAPSQLARKMLDYTMNRKARL